jgi:osmotically inducible protein OsmC
MATRTAETNWTGGLRDGAGTVTLISSGLGSFDVSFPKRIADSADGTTSPEELIAAAHSSCYAMAFSGELAKEGLTPETITVKADVEIHPDPAGGLRITEISLTVRGRVTGGGEDAFVKAAEQAKVGCPVSKALTGTTITLDAALA